MSFGCGRVTDSATPTEPRFGSDASEPSRAARGAQALSEAPRIWPQATSVAPAAPANSVAAAPAGSADAQISPPDATNSPSSSSFEPGTADLDPDNDALVAPPAPISDCEARLERLGVRFVRAALPLSQKRGTTYTCGAEQVVVYRGGPRAIRYNSAPLLTCGMALALARFEVVLSEEAERAFGQSVVRIEQGGTYNCRKMARFRDLVSEHSYGNAIDVRSFTLANGQKISVLAHFGAIDMAPLRREGVFLRNLARRLYDEGVFSVVLTRFFDPLHRDHFHLYLARYRVDGTR